MDDIVEEISFQSYDDDLRLLFSLLNDVLQRELGPNIMEKIEHTRTLSQVYVPYMFYLLSIVIRAIFFTWMLIDRSFTIALEICCDLKHGFVKL